LVETRHYASEDISDKLSSLDSCWQGLVEASREKTLRLQQAYQVQGRGRPGLMITISQNRRLRKIYMKHLNVQQCVATV